MNEQQAQRIEPGTKVRIVGPSRYANRDYIGRTGTVDSWNAYYEDYLVDFDDGRPMYAFAFTSLEIMSQTPTGLENDSTGSGAESQLRPGESVWVRAKVVDSVVDERIDVKVNIQTRRAMKYGIDLVIPLSALRRAE